MITADIMGRLGNQMFQIAAAESLAYDLNTFAYFPSNVIGATPTDEERSRYSTSILRNVKYIKDLSQVKNDIRHVFKESINFSYQEIPKVDNLYIHGYFQSEKYFSHNRKIIENLFSPTQEILDYLDVKYLDLISRDDTVSVNIRRGDYLTDKYINHHGLTELDYYNEAIELFPNHKFVFFSDDIKWCKETFKSPEYIFINGEYDVIDFYLISLMKNNIIANSTFPWWAAWLNKNYNKKIIAPKNWFGKANSHLDTSHVIPESWIKL